MEGSRPPVKPIVIGRRIKCPVCGAAGMQTNRRNCYECGSEFSPDPWRCGNCGYDNLYRSRECFNCGATSPDGFSSDLGETNTAARPVHPTPVQKNSCATLNESFRTQYGEDHTPAASPKPVTPPLRDPCAGMGMKWYYFLIYGYLIVCAVSNFLSGVVDLFNGSIMFTLLWTAVGVDALLTRSFLAKKKTHAPAALLAYLLWSCLVNCFEVWMTWEETMSSTFADLGDVLQLASDFDESMKLIIIFSTFITTAIMICCNATYFKKRKAMFVN